MARRPASKKSTIRASKRPGRAAKSAGRKKATNDGAAAEDALRARFRSLVEFDRELTSRGYASIAGVDEAGRGALAGPVVAAAVVLREDCNLIRIYDCKAVAEADRESLFLDIVASAVSVGIAFSHPAVIDRDNILRATLASMHRAVEALRLTPDIVLIDGREGIQWPGRVVPVIKGDAKSLCVAAASIVAKVARDRFMRRLHRAFPSYHFDQNKGYGTRDHLAAIAAFGAAAVHRRSFLGKVVANEPSMF
ncbi:MAG TPA: ribonuclease HII [Candidatus Krumholzibacteria bacterium]|nr:ribonuclease HII [Candidatus Krumholzibacteria bacterium]